MVVQRGALKLVDEVRPQPVCCAVLWGDYGGGDCLTFVWATDMQVRAVTPLTVLLRLGSCLIDPSRERVVRLQSWLGFNALIGSMGMLNSIWEVYSKLSCMIALRMLCAISFA